MSIKTGIIGAAGYAGIELVRLLCAHPEFDVKVITSDADAGSPLSSVYPAFHGATDLAFTKHDDPAIDDCDVVFMSVPHTAAMARVPSLLAKGITVIDLSADYRIKHAHVYEEWYGVTHTSPELLADTAFGLPEITGGELGHAAERYAAGEAVLVACAGCYPTATSLAAYPAVLSGFVKEGLIVVDAISGVSGAGKGCSQRTHFCSANENIEAYAVGGHRHTPEIEQILDLPGQVVFTPHLAPLTRGMISTVTMPLEATGAGPSALANMRKNYERFYRNCPFVHLLPEGQMPKSSSVVGTNYAHIGLAVQEHTGTLVAVCAIDNLCKGAAGQAVQSANIVCGLPQTTGLQAISPAV